MTLRKLEQLTITVLCDHTPRHSAVFTDNLPGPAEVARVLKVQGCRYNGDTLAKDPIFAPPPMAEVAVEEEETNTDVESVTAPTEEDAGTDAATEEKDGDKRGFLGRRKAGGSNDDS